MKAKASSLPGGFLVILCAICHSAAKIQTVLLETTLYLLCFMHSREFSIAIVSKPLYLCCCFSVRVSVNRLFGRHSGPLRWNSGLVTLCIFSRERITKNIITSIEFRRIRKLLEIIDKVHSTQRSV